MSARGGQRRRFTRTRRRPTAVRMMKVILRVAGTDVPTLERFTKELVLALKGRGAKVSGPIRLPTKNFWLVVRKTPCGQGTMTFDFFQLSIHKRLIVAELTSKDLVFLVGRRVPPNVWTEIRLEQKQK